MPLAHAVRATREGLVGHKTSTGWIITPKIPFVALPSVKALYRSVFLLNPLTNLSCEALVLDVGPWNEHDDAYVFGTSAPQAESGIDTFGRVTNKAGIDLGEWVWHKIGMLDNGYVQWSFCLPQVIPA